MAEGVIWRRSPGFHMSGRVSLRSAQPFILDLKFCRRPPTRRQGPAEVLLGRPAKSGEKYAHSADASRPGEALAGLKLQGLSAAEAARLVREHDLEVAYELDWPLRNGDKGVRSEQDVPVSRIDPGWSVARAETYNDGVIVLHVVPGPAATPPPGF